jgi:sec-independent protein translocase protein TatA
MPFHPGGLGGPELLIVLVIIIIIFGVGKLPQVGGALGQSIKEFRKASTEEEKTKQDEIAAKRAEEETAAKAKQEPSASEVQSKEKIV